MNVLNPTPAIFIPVVLSGEFIVVNKHLLRDLVKLNLWNSEIKNRIVAANGSVQEIAEIPEQIKEVYKTVWEIKQRAVIDMAADRGAFIDQSQSLNLFIQDPNFAKLSSMHFYAWKKLKTGMYYLRTKAATDAIKFTVEGHSNHNIVATTQISKEEAMAEISCSIDNKDDCLACGS